MNANDTYGVAGATSPAKQKFIASAASKVYKGPSLVDYLSLSGYPTDATSRTGLAKEYGINNYSVNPGNAAVNTDFLGRLRGGGAPETPSNPAVPTGTGVLASQNTGVPGANPNAPAMGTQNAAPDPYKTAFDSYLDTLRTTPEEKAAKEYLNKLVTEDRLAKEKALASGETLGYATGEAERVGRNNAITIDAAARSLDALSGFRKNENEISKARMDFEAAQLKRAEEANKPFELSPGQERYSYNPTTGKYEKTASVPKAQDTSFELSPGQERYEIDPATGQYRKVASVPRAPQRTITEIGGNRVLVDENTGQTIKVLGKATSQSTTEDPIISQDLKDAQAAIDAGADPAKVRQRFLEKHQNKGSLYNDYFGGEGVRF